NAEDFIYAYDVAWNLSYRSNYWLGPESFYCDVKNDLTNTIYGNVTYDGNGNLTAMFLDWGSTPVETLCYDDENRLVRWLYNGDTTDPLGCDADPVGGVLRRNFVYDGLGRLRQRLDYVPDSYGNGTWELASETRYIYDGMRVIQERDGDNTPTVSYTRGNDLSGTLEGAGGIGGLLARSAGYSSGNWTSHAYYFADVLGNITYMINASESPVASYRYDPFGSLISSSGSLASDNVYRFSSKEIHLNSGL